MRRTLLLLALGCSVVLLATAGGAGLEMGYAVDPAALPSPVSSAPAVADRAAESIAAVRQAVTHSLPFIQEEGQAWIDLHGCLSCHQVPVMLWSQHAARDRGFAVDEKALEERTQWAIGRLSDKETDNWDGMGPVLLGRPQQGELRHQLESLAQHIAAGQEVGGGWQAQGQLPLQRRPEEETHRVSTIWAALAIASTEPAEEEDLAATLAAAHQQIAAWRGIKGESFEWQVVKMLYEATLGDTTLADQLLGEILALQHEDGGWAWMIGEKSDAFATGQALYALGRLGRPATAPAIERGRHFLVESQQEDGSWALRSTLRREEGVTPTSRYWGTGWAVIGLLETLPVG